MLIILLITLFSAALVLISIVTMASCTAFWITNSFPVLNLAWKLREFSPYPMSIFDGAFRFLFTFLLPIGFVAFYPSQFFLRPGTISPLLYISPLVGDRPVRTDILGLDVRCESIHRHRLLTVLIWLRLSRPAK